MNEPYKYKCSRCNMGITIFEEHVAVQFVLIGEEKPRPVNHYCLSCSMDESSIIRFCDLLTQPVAELRIRKWLG